MESPLEYLARVHELCQERYEPPNPLPEQECLGVVYDVAFRFHMLGKWPYCLRFRKKGGGAESLLFPLQYDGKVPWKVHYVCCEGAWAYDPVVGFPIVLPHYSRAVFGEEVRWSLALDELKLFEEVRKHAVGGRFALESG